MIRYDLRCDQGHEFDGWFADSAAYDQQAADNLVECPVCGSVQVRKQITAPAVQTGRGAREHMANMISEMRRHIEETHTHVGKRFADEARAMHLGDKPQAPIYGEATAEEVRTLHEDGVPVAPLPDALVPIRNRKSVN